MSELTCNNLEVRKAILNYCKSIPAYLLRCISTEDTLYCILFLYFITLFPYPLTHGYFIVCTLFSDSGGSHGVSGGRRVEETSSYSKLNISRSPQPTSPHSRHVTPQCFYLSIAILSHFAMTCFIHIKGQ